MGFPRGQAAIAGIGATEFSRDSGVSTFTLAARAVKAAIKDAGLELSDIDGFATFGTADTVSPNLLAQALGVQNMRYYLDQYYGGSVSLSTIGAASLAVSAGVADCVVVYRALNGRSEQRKNGSGALPTNLPWDIPYKLSAGTISPGTEFGLFARTHMEKYGTTNEDFGRMAMLCRAHAMDNERAQQRAPMTMDDYLASPFIAEPLRKFDYCLESDGAVAVVIVSAERAKDLPHRPALIQGAAWGGGINIVNNGYADLTDSPAKVISERVYKSAGVGPSDIDMAQLYDCFTFTLMAQIEGYGFSKPGETGAKAASGAFNRDGGEVPVNTHGGLMSEAYIHGLNHVYEAVEQIRGDAGVRQVKKHNTALVTGQVGYLSGYSSAIVLVGA